MSWYDPQGVMDSLGGILGIHKLVSGGRGLVLRGLDDVLGSFFGGCCWSQTAIGITIFNVFEFGGCFGAP